VQGQWKEEGQGGGAEFLKRFSLGTKQQRPVDVVKEHHVLTFFSLGLSPWLCTNLDPPSFLSLPAHRRLFFARNYWLHIRG
jgi:hypothetical protein